MEQELINKLSDLGITYFIVPSDNLLAIYNIYFKNIVDSENKSEIYLNYLAIYYEFLIKNLELAEKYYLMAIDKSNIDAMNNLAYMYEKQNIYELAEKYYLMACDKGYVIAMNNLADMYKNRDKYELAEKYFLMAMNKGYVAAINNLAYMYKTQKKYELAEKYYLMAIYNGDFVAMNNLAYMYKEQEKYELAEKYYLMAIDHDYKEAIYNLAFMYKKQNNLEFAEKYCLMAANNYDTRAHDEINNMLDKNFDIGLAVKAESFLNENNIQKMNNFLAYYYENRNTNFNGRLVENMDCVVCQNLCTVLFLKCSHPICVKCFNENKLCNICG